MSSAQESSPDTGPMLPGFETLETATEPERVGNSQGLWPTPVGDGDRQTMFKQGGMPLGVAARRWPTPRGHETGDYQYDRGNHDRPRPTLTGAVKMDSHPSTSSAAGSPASPSPTPAGAGATPTNAGSGPSSYESYARLDPDGRWLRMYQDCFQSTLEGSLEECSGTWPRAGTMRNGTSYRQLMSGRRTSESASSSWLTPSVEDAGRMGKAENWDQYEKDGRTTQARLRNQVAKWPTSLPSGVDGGRTTKGKKRQNETGLRVAAGGQLSPTWVELLMGFPPGWTDIASTNPIVL